VVEVNHVSGAKGGVAGVYNRAVYLPERARGLGEVGLVSDGQAGFALPFVTDVSADVVGTLRV
jgi:hypothetical protein